jgi:hypothetical protein
MRRALQIGTRTKNRTYALRIRSRRQNCISAMSYCDRYFYGYNGNRGLIFRGKNRSTKRKPVP